MHMYPARKRTRRPEKNRGARALVDGLFEGPAIGNSPRTKVNSTMHW